MKKMAGVTLIELMVVMTIIAILTAIAVPAYQSHVTKANRGAAKSCLSEYAQYMERFYTTNLTYVGADANPGCQSDSNLKLRYTFATSNLTQKTYDLTATPIGVQALRDTQCAVLSMNQDGTPNATGSGGKAFCW